MTLLVPQTRDGSFSPDIFKRYQRSERAFVLALMEMVVQGVSARKVSAILSIALDGLGRCRLFLAMQVPHAIRSPDFRFPADADSAEFAS